MQPTIPPALNKTFDSYAKAALQGLLASSSLLTEAGMRPSIDQQTQKCVLSAITDAALSCAAMAIEKRAQYLEMP